MPSTPRTMWKNLCFFGLFFHISNCQLRKYLSFCSIIIHFDCETSEIHLSIHSWVHRWGGGTVHPICKRGNGSEGTSYATSWYAPLLQTYIMILSNWSAMTNIPGTPCTMNDFCGSELESSHRYFFVWNFYPKNWALGYNSGNIL